VLGLWSINILSFLKPYHESTTTFFFPTTFFFSNNTSRHHVIFYQPQHTSVFFFLNNSSNNKWFNYKIPSWRVCIIIHFLTCYLTRYQRPIMLEFYHLLALGGCLVYTLIDLLILSIIFLSFSHIISNMTWTIISFNCKPTLMCVHTSHQPYGYPPFTLHPWQ
jgi:hypothetical protein